MKILNAVQGRENFIAVVSKCAPRQSKKLKFGSQISEDIFVASYRESWKMGVVNLAISQKTTKTSPTF